MTTVAKVKDNRSAKTVKTSRRAATSAPKRKSRSSGQAACAKAEPLKIFISHKHNHAFIASRLKSFLESNSKQSIQVYVSGDIQPGTEWLADIKQALAEAHILVFLYLDETLDHNWCWVELGLFMDPTRQDEGSILCFHPHEAPPEPLKHLQTIRAEPDKVVECLKTMFAGDAFVGRAKPINPDLGADTKKLRDLANKIVALIGKEGVYTWRPHHYLTVELDTEQQVKSLVETKTVPGDALVKEYDDSRTIPGLFGLAPNQVYPWSSLVDKSQARGNTLWVQDFGKACAKAADKELDVGIKSTLRAFEGGLLFRPAISFVEDYHGKGIRFHVLFTSEVKQGRITGTGRLAAVFRMIHLGYRFRDEVIYPFRYKLHQLSDQEGVADTVRRLDQAIDLISIEADELGLLTEVGLTEPFEVPEIRTRLAGMLKDWCENIAPGLKQAVANEDLAALEASLAQLQDVNSEFIAICGQRFADLSDEDLRRLRESPALSIG